MNDELGVQGSEEVELVEIDAEEMPRTMSTAPPRQPQQPTEE